MKKIILLMLIVVAFSGCFEGESLNKQEEIEIIGVSFIYDNGVEADYESSKAPRNKMVKLKISIAYNVYSIENPTMEIYFVTDNYLKEDEDKLKQVSKLPNESFTIEKGEGTATFTTDSFMLENELDGDGNRLHPDFGDYLYVYLVEEGRSSDFDVYNQDGVSFEIVD